MSRTTPRRSTRKPTTPTRKLAVQDLESRSLMSAAFDPADQILRVTGTEAAETIRVINNAGTIRVEGETIRLADGSTVESLPASAVNFVRVDGLAGDDRIEMVQLGVAADGGVILEANGGMGNDTIVGGSAADRLNGGPEDDLLIGGFGEDVFDGDGGDDELIQSIGIDARPLFGDSVTFDYATQNTTAPFEANVAAGTHFVASAGGAIAVFTVAADGTIGYEPALEGVLTGAGTSLLSVNGAQVSINATRLLAPDIVLDYVSINATDSISTALLPGDHFVRTAGGGNVFFNVGTDGQFSYDRSLEGVLAGAGTSTLSVNGATVTIDARDLWGTDLNVDYLFISTSVPLTAGFLPGDHFLYASGGAITSFNVGTDGSLNYDAALEGSFSGKGTSTLRVVGQVVAIDPSKVAGGVSYLNNLPIPATAFEANLLPGLHWLSPALVFLGFRTHRD